VHATSPEIGEELGWQKMVMDIDTATIAHDGLL
jgi:hypothetical protein